jgi:hypothetical protein
VIFYGSVFPAVMLFYTVTEHIPTHGLIRGVAPLWAWVTVILFSTTQPIILVLPLLLGIPQPWSGLWVLCVATLLLMLHFNGAEDRTTAAWDWFRSLSIWCILWDAFNVCDVIDEETAQLLASDKAAMLIVHPHGHWPLGVCTSMLSYGGDPDATHGAWKKRIRVLVSDIGFWCPGLRQLVLYFGGVSSNWDTVRRLIDAKYHVAITAGGLAEIERNVDRAVLEISTKHRGFCALAVEKNTPVIPVFVKNEFELIREVCRIPLFDEWLHVGSFTPKHRILSGPHPTDITVYYGKPIYPQRDADGDPDRLHAIFYNRWATLATAYESPEKLGETVKHCLSSGANLLKPVI